MNKKADGAGIWQELSIIILIMLIIGAIVYGLWQILPK